MSLQSPREALVTASRDAWKNRLIDLSRRNNLLFYKPLVNGTLELPLTAELMEFLSGGGSVALSDLVDDRELAAPTIRTITRKGLENLEEKGLSTLFLALGQCSWTAEDGGRDPFAPIFLFPVTLKFKGHDIQSTEIEIAGDLEVNPVLIHVLNEELNVRFSAEDALTVLRPDIEDPPDEIYDAEDEPEEERVIDFDAVLELLTTRARKVPGFSAKPFAVIGNFSFQKLAMVKDLENRTADLISSELVAAIAGDSGARAGLSSSHIGVDPKGLDLVPPDLEFSVMEADSSQQAAISGIMLGQSAIVHGPPGTGKSQTITNLIATLAANGKKILFVAEKRAALEVVKSRLASVGLDHLAIDLHGADLAPKKVMEQVAKTLTLVRNAVSPSVGGTHEAFVERRRRLNQHDERVHKIHAPAELSIYQMQGILLRLPSGADSAIRWRGSELTAITPERAKQVRDLLGEASGFASLFNLTDPSPWCGVELPDAQFAQKVLDLARWLAHEGLPALMRSLTELASQAKLRAPVNMTESIRLLENAASANILLSEYQKGIFREAKSLVLSMAPGHVGGFKGTWARFTSGSYRRALKRARILRTGGKTSAVQVWEDANLAAAVFEFWQAFSGSDDPPRSATEADPGKHLYDLVRQSLSDAGRTFKFLNQGLTLDDLLACLQKIASEDSTPYRVSRVCEIERGLRERGVERLVEEIRTSKVPAKDWIPRFEYIWLSSTLDLAALSDPGVRAFVGSTHNSYVEDFQKLDASRIDLAAARVRRAHGEHAIKAMNEFPGQESIIRSEAAKSRRHKPLRRIFAEASDVLTAVCPCWMASPLSVCQLLGTNTIFDYVIFDEASQILPEDAIPSILRAKHAVVAGDNHQLPPTTFFAASDEDDDESEADGTGYESLLDMMIPFVRGFHLNWHYRSRDESLIAFSNHHIYDDRLVTFPGAGTSKAISHVFVDSIPTSDLQEESSGPEVNKVVELIMEHARTAPDVSLGVITMGIKHANRIQAALDRELNGEAEFSEFFDTGKNERFFIKNLERVQGDERDAIIISVGYGKNRGGSLPLSFGPILSLGGRRRLNVAVTRAKQKVTVVSSFKYSDIDSSKVRPQTGLEFLKNYLEYASSGGQLITSGELSTEPMNEFELDVYEALTSKGIVLVPQLGCSKFRIDFAACHPSSPGKYVLAIECDGATYHSSYTARDRDRLRQQQLERLGWTFHRIWSTDWFLRRQEEIDRVIQAYEKAVQKSNGNGRSGQGPASARNRTQQTQTAPPRAGRTSLRAPIPVRNSIDEYSPTELMSLLRWVKSDGKLRTNDELVDEMFEALPFSRRGSRIDAALKRVVASG
jgi:very-short-patch-repair endonuclease